MHVAYFRYLQQTLDIALVKQFLLKEKKTNNFVIENVINAYQNNLVGTYLIFSSLGACLNYDIGNAGPIIEWQDRLSMFQVARGAKRAIWMDT